LLKVTNNILRLAKLDGDWHEFESKALRKENERKDKEARRQAQKEAALKAEKDKKRPPDADAGDHKAKRLHTEEPSSVSSTKADGEDEKMASDR
jgi:CTD kinase subunit alpha